MNLPSLTTEIALWKKGLTYIVGVDEVGRGSWAGPLVAAGVILPQNFKIPVYFADSKKVSQKKRKEFDILIREKAVATKIIEISSRRVNKIGISRATQFSFRKIIRNITPAPNYSLIDAFHIKYLSLKKQRAIIKGDTISASIAAASIIAKVYRDNLMEKLALNYPSYGFEKHKGYGTKFHQSAINKYGFSPIHRTSYKLKFLN